MHTPRKRRRTTAARTALTGVAVALLLAACSAGAAAQPGPVTQRVPQAPETFRPFVDGLLVRTAFVTDSAGGYHVEVWDLLVGPGMRSAEAWLPGGAVVQVRAGTGVLQSDRRGTQLAPGATFTLAEGAGFSVANGRDDLGLSSAP